MAKTYENLEDLLKDLQADIENAVQSDVDKAVKKVYKKETERIYTENVGIREPRKNGSRYRMGLEGSFADEENFEEEIKSTGDGIEYILHNERVSDCTCDYCVNSDTHLDYFIENGIYGGHGYKKRPAYERSMEEIEENNVVEKALSKGLTKKGWGLE